MTENPSPYVPESFLLRAASGLAVAAAASLCGVRPSAYKAWEAGGEVPDGALDPLRPLARPATSGGGSFRFVDLFAGIGGMRRAFEAAGGDCVMTAEWNREAARTYVANHGLGHDFVGDIRSLAAADAPDHEILVGGFPCFPAGTLVEAESGLKAIEEIELGERVSTHQKRLRPVLSVMKRDGATLLSVKVTGIPAFGTTDEHPFYVRKRTRRWNNERRGYDYEFSAPEWLAARELDGDCFAALPMMAESMGVRSWESPAFWYVVGRWLGDGWIVDVARKEAGREGHRSKRAVICTGLSDADNLSVAIKAAGLHATRADERTVAKFHICSHSFVEFLEPFGRGAAHKRVPSFVFSAPMEVQEYLWNGWVDADGHRIGSLEKCEVTTISRALAIGMARVARNAFGRVACVRESKVAATTVIEGRTVNQRTQFKVTLATRNHGCTFIEDGFAWVKVKSVTQTGEVATVHNIEVAEDNSYVAEGVVVHNCQPFSLAGVSKKNSLGRSHGFADETQGTLFFDVARILAEKRPAAFLLENVRNLLSHDRGRTFEVIRRTLADELGYVVSFRVMDGSAWVPQRRPRIFLVGFREGEAFDFDTVRVPDAGPRLGSILHSGAHDPAYAPQGLAAAKYTLSDGLWSYLRNYAAKHQAAGNGFGYGLVGEGDVARTLSARYGKDGSEILVRNGGGNPRRLTPRECSRLMGFDAVGAPMVIPVSDAQAYRQFGNSVVVPCVAAIAAAMAERLGAGAQEREKLAQDAKGHEARELERAEVA